MLQYIEDKKRLNNILLTSENIKNNRNEILEIIPELKVCVKCTQYHPAHRFNVYEHIEETTNNVKSDIILKLSALLHDIGKPYRKTIDDGVERFIGHEIASEVLAKLILERLGYEEEIIQKVCKIIKYHDYKIEATIDGIREIVNIMGEELMPYLLKIKVADLLAHSQECYDRVIPKLNNITKIYNEYLCQSCETS